MGNSSRSPEDYEIVSRYREDDWIREINERGFPIWRNRLTNETAELIQLGAVPSTENLDIYTTRTMENDLVKVHHLLIDSQSDLCALYKSSHLLIEHIPLRLSSLRNFDREEALTIFAACLRAFHLLQIKFGPIVPHEDLIGFNEQGKTKVWVNRNICFNFAQRQNISEEFQQAGRRVQLLFEMIEQRARYVLLPPVIKEEIYQPLSSHLSTLKALQKFAYYQKLNLRKYLILGYGKSHQIATQIQRNHVRNRSNFTEVKPEQHLCCQKNSSSVFSSSVKETELRRNYSLNNIHNQPTTFYVPPQIYARKSELSSLNKHSIASNKSSFMQSARPAIPIFYVNQPLSIPSTQHVRNTYHRQEVVRAESLQNNNKTENKVNNIHAQNIETHPQTPELKQKVEQFEQINEKQQNIIEKQKEIQSKPQEKIEDGEYQCKILVNNKQFSIIDKLNAQTLDAQVQILQNIEKNPDKEANFEPSSPTFVQQADIKYDFLSFAPSQENLQSKDSPNYPQGIQTNNGKQLNMNALGDKIYNIIINQQSKVSNADQSDEQRRLSIENKAPKLEFSPDIILPTGNLLNCFTSVQSKLHMATNRQHSIIDPNPKQESIVALNQYEDEQIEQYIRQKYKNYHKQDQNLKELRKDSHQTHSKVKRIESKYVSIPQKSPTSNQNTHLNPRKQPYINNFPVQQDFLDVNFLQKSLDKRYNNEQQQLKAQEKRRQMQQNDALNIAKLEEGLLRFSKSQLSQKNSEVPSKQHMQKKNEHHEQTIEPSTGFDSHYPFKEKKSNEVTASEGGHLHEKSLAVRKNSRQNSKHYEEKPQYRYQDNHREEDTINEYSFQENKRGSYSISQEIKANNHKGYFVKPAQHSSFEYSDYTNPNFAKTSKPRGSIEEEDGRSSSKTKTPSTRKISYEQLRQFLWN